MEIGRIIRVARTRRGLTQRDLATLAGLSEITVRQVEAGRRAPSMKTFDRMLGAMGLAATLHVHAARDADAEELSRLARLTHEERLAEAGDLIPVLLFGALLDREVQFAVDGRLALLLQGLPVAVTDVALTLWDDDGNLERAGEVLGAAGGGPASAEDLLLGYDASFALTVRASDLRPDGIRRHRDGWWMSAECTRLRLGLDPEDPVTSAVPVTLQVLDEQLTLPVLPAHVVVERDPALSVVASQAAERKRRPRSA